MAAFSAAVTGVARRDRLATLAALRADGRAQPEPHATRPNSVYRKKQVSSGSPRKAETGDTGNGQGSRPAAQPDGCLRLLR